MAKPATLTLEDGTTYYGHSFGADGERLAEVVFNTSMCGYQEILTDPSYCGQAITMTYPQQGIYGVNHTDMQSRKAFAEAMIVYEHAKYPSNWRSEGTLSEFLVEQGVVGICGVDTRAITRHIRVAGAMRGVVSTEDHDRASLLKKVKAWGGIDGVDLAGGVSCDQPYVWPETPWGPAADPGERVTEERYRIVALDYGIKYAILRNLFIHGFDVTVLPGNSTVETIMSCEPEGVFLSNGPGDPEGAPYAVEAIERLLEMRLPIFGICLGFEFLGLALGGEKYKLKFGHRGGNHPVKRLQTGRVEITAQNHGYGISRESLEKLDVTVTHVNLDDGSAEGLHHNNMPVLGVQYHPEASPGPHDSRYLFAEFARMIKARRSSKPRKPKAATK